MAERISQEDGIENNLSNSSLQGGAGLRDGSTDGGVDASVKKLCREIAAAQEKRREEIEAAYPRVFGSGTKTDNPQQSVGTVHWEFGYGWDTLVANLARMIDNEIARDPSLLEGGSNSFRVMQMKEKFGTLRFYYEGGNDRIRGLVDMTEQLSGTVCEVCGSLGTLCRSAKGAGGWYKTLCEDCAVTMEYGVVPLEDEV